MMKKRTKSLTIDINHDPTHLGPNGQLLIYGTPEQPAVITGQVVFETNHDAKGEDLHITFSALVKVDFCDDASKSKEGFVQKDQLELKKLHVGLKHDSPGKINTGRYSFDINFPIPAHFPSSMYVWNGVVEYRVRARIPRKEPSADILQESIIWVLNSNIPAESRDGSNLSPCLIPDVTKGIGSPEAIICKIPSTVLIAGETLAVSIESVPRQQTVDGSDDTASVFSGESHGGLLSAPKMPTIRASLKQIITYRHVQRGTSLQEKRKFASVFRFDKETERGALLPSYDGGWSVVLRMALPRLGAKRVDPKETKVQDELEGLKTTMDNSLLTIEHSLEIKLIWDTMVRLFKIPVTIVPPSGPGLVPSRFDHIRWTSGSIETDASHDSTALAKMDYVDKNAKLTQAAETFLRAVRRP
ncbi:hypothetical protein BGX31_000501 [Mortierella sp. GBA43]|nr:hypothetical protein BGX31_000501 [Mortierella sp. GBA43]